MPDGLISLQLPELIYNINLQDFIDSEDMEMIIFNNIEASS
jgi:hypothetical protein